MYKRLIAIVIILGMFSSLFSSSISNVKGYSSLADFVNSIKPATSSSSFSDGNFYAYLKVANGKNVLFAWVKGSGSIYVYEYSNNAWTVKSTINGVLPGSEQTQILSYPVKLSSNSSGSLTVTITGNDFVNIGDIESYSINISGGTPPYNVSWTCNRSNPSSGSATVPSAFSVSLLFNSYGSGSISVNVTDARGDTATATLDIYVIYVSFFDSGKAGLILSSPLYSQASNLFSYPDFFSLYLGNVSLSSITLNGSNYSFTNLFVQYASPTLTVNGISFTCNRYVMLTSSSNYIKLGKNVLSFTVIAPSGKSKNYSFEFIGNIYVLPRYFLQWTYYEQVTTTEFYVPLYVSDPNTGNYKRFDFTVDDSSDLQLKFVDFYQKHADWIDSSLQQARQGGGKSTTSITASADSCEVFQMKELNNYKAFAIATYTTVDNQKVYYPYYETRTYTSLQSQIANCDVWYNVVNATLLYNGSPFTVQSSVPGAIEVVDNPLSSYVRWQYVRVSAPTTLTFDYTGQGAIDAKRANISASSGTPSNIAYALRYVSTFYPSSLDSFRKTVVFPQNALLSDCTQQLAVQSFDFSDTLVLVRWVYPQSLSVTVNGFTHVDVVGLLNDNTYLYPQVQSRNTTDYIIIPDKVGFNFVPKNIGQFSVTFSELDKPFTMQFNVVGLSNIPVVVVNDDKGAIKVRSNIYGDELHYDIGVDYYGRYQYWEYVFNQGSFVANIVGLSGGNTSCVTSTLGSGCFVFGVVNVQIISAGYQGSVKFVFDFDGTHDETVVPAGSAYSKTYTLWQSTYPSYIIQDLPYGYTSTKPYTLSILYSPDNMQWYSLGTYAGVVILKHR